MVHRNRLWVYTGNAVPTWFRDNDSGEGGSKKTEVAVIEVVEPIIEPEVELIDDGSSNTTSDHRYPQRGRGPPSRYGVSNLVYCCRDVNDSEGDSVMDT